jgi:DNA anti-recombination protein RmuC
MEGASPQTDAAHSADDNESEKSGMKRKRRYSGSEEVLELREELKRMRDENEKLRIEMEAQNEHSLSMMQQIAELQDALRHGISTGPLGAPTAQMI